MTVSIGKLNVFVIKPHEIDEETYKNAHTLLKIYKDVLWRIEGSISELDCLSRELLGENLAFAIEVLDKFDYRLNQSKLEDDLYDIAEVKSMVELIARALVKLKSYPHHGEQYFDLLEKNFLLKYPYSEDEILTNLNIGRTTYYRQRKDAIKLFGYCLWNVIVPDIATDLNLQSRGT